ncbi:MAG: TonB-dependent receptor [Elusimicrobia bacterium]|nr:TonB-dependent receptor [Elusimicrobiota bacterium]
MWHPKDVVKGGSTKKLIAAALTLAAGVSARAAADDFEFFKEEAQFVTASRRPEPALRAPAAVDVITASDIKAYGFKEIWDVLRYRAGMDVLDGTSIDGNRALVSARGFTQEFVQEMQVLVDGRSVYNPLFGGVYWKSLPVQMQDIERIEIARGPNAVLYGSNAGLGVINIITKKPAASSEAAAEAWGGTQGAVGTSESGSAGGAAGAIRVSHEYRSQDHAATPSGVGSSNGFMHTQKRNARARWNPDAKTELEALGGGSWLTAGIPGLSNSPTAENAENFQALHGTRSLGGGSGAEASLSRSETTIHVVSLPTGPAYIRTYQYDAEALHHFSWLDERVTSNWGGNWRFSGADSDQLFSGDPRQSNRLVRGFMHHTARVAEPLTLVAGVSLEHSDTGGTQPAWQAAALCEPAADQIVRLAYSRAPTIPALFFTRGNYLLTPNLKLGASGDLKPEQLSSWELGWNGRLLDGALKPAVSLYVMSVRSLDFAFREPPSVPAVNSVDNRNAALARGAELSVEYALAPERALFANYTFEKISTDKGAAVSGTDHGRSTPRHKFNVGGRAALARGVTLSAIMGYKDNYHTVSSRGTRLDAPRSFRLDARLGWTPRPGWELFVAGQNLLQPYTVEYADGAANPRTVRGGLSARFAP